MEEQKEQKEQKSSRVGTITSIVVVAIVGGYILFGGKVAKIEPPKPKLEENQEIQAPSPVPPTVENPTQVSPSLPSTSSSSTAPEIVATNTPEIQVPPPPANLPTGQAGLPTGQAGMPPAPGNPNTPPPSVPGGPQY